MTFDEIKSILPNGFHDAFLRTLSVDYVSRTAEIELEVWVGIIKLGEYDPLNPIDYLTREGYRRGRLRFTDVLLFSADAPNGDFLQAEPNGVGIGIDLVPADYDMSLLEEFPDEPLPEGVFFRSFIFSGDANSFLRVAAHGANWTWLSETRVIY